ncbi:hypothetical protein EXIGLDRAFT_678944 [Exidia glandulosa HHB12029]|uniref:GH16 domain-containing protein n=1 Tax=Exidia glandulosa HHB12029 TaxID=1314781 RepID=A0A165F653_EXIGL|nr:hypothetical protein EXIGLDRAFT_678944 [Exidia glandulosa HHB12029]
MQRFWYLRILPVLLCLLGTSTAVQVSVPETGRASISLSTVTTVAATSSTPTVSTSVAVTSSATSIPASSSSTSAQPIPTTTVPPVPIPTPTKYKIQTNFVGDAFYDGFTFFTDDDPTHGRVNYVDEEIARSQNLSQARHQSFVIRADAKHLVIPDAVRGRNSVRITSKTWYTTHVLVADIRHMPEGAATWPALWEFGENWPSRGEVDILEGANDVAPNLSSLHTSPGCLQPETGRRMTGTATGLNCDATAPGNSGCGVQYSSAASYGPSFNAAGGGWYALERTDAAIKIWFWGRHAHDVPLEVKQGAQVVHPNEWGSPSALFVMDACPLREKFGPNQIVINLTLCGDWAGNTYPGGKAACIDFVNNNPAAFSDAYWDFARLSVYV